MATSDDNQLYPDIVQAFEDDGYRFRGMLPASDHEHWDVLVKRAKTSVRRPLPADDRRRSKVTNRLHDTRHPEAEISRLRQQLHAVESPTVDTGNETQERHPW